jgi:hypothetical protein
VVLHLRFGTCPPVRLSRAFGSVSNGPQDLIISARSGALARVYTKNRFRSAVSGCSRTSCSSGGGTDRAAALVLPKTCPQGSARHSGDADFILFPASFKDPGRAHLVEALRVTEVLRRTVDRLICRPFGSGR